MSKSIIPKQSRTIFGVTVLLSGGFWGMTVSSGSMVAAVIAILFTLLMLFLLFFFRDPDRKVPDGDQNIVSPCDGRVLSIKPCSPDLLDKPGRVISIFMSIFNVHVNRNVCSGTVLEVHHQPGRFGHAGRDRASQENEQTRILIDHPPHRVMVSQVAGMLARRIICRSHPGDSVERGDRFGMIVLGSRLDVALPDTVEVTVKVGEVVRAGETIIGVFNS
jgi:phosphatidylserine decarboxylase